MIKHCMFFFSIMIVVVGCQQQQEVITSKPTTPQTATPPPIRAVPPVIPVIEARQPHYKHDLGHEYGYQSSEESQEMTIVRYLGIKNERHTVQMNPTKAVHSILTCDAECSTVTATNFFNDQLMGTEIYTGPGSLEEVIMQDAKAGLLKKY